MQNGITNSQIDLGALSHLGNGNIIFDTTSIVWFLLAVSIVFLAISIIIFVRYQRDKDNIPDLRKIEKKIDFYSIDLIRINNRLNDLEEKSGNINDLHKSISELKSLIRRKKNV